MVQPFQLDVQSLVHDYFLLPQTSREDLEDLYHLPFFFQAAEVDVGAAAADFDQEQATGRKDSNSAAWPAWVRGGMDHVEPSPAEAAHQGQPRVLASFTNRLPYLVERRIGQGRVMFVSSGFSPSWSTIGLTNTIIVFDRILRDMLQSTFPVRNMTTDQQHVEPVAAAERHYHFTWSDSTSGGESLSVDAIGSDQYALTIRRPAMRGLYRVSAANVNGGTQEQKVWEFPLAVNGPADESQLQPASIGPSRDATPAEALWTASGTVASGESQVGAQYLWRRWMLGALACLVVELVVLGGPFLRRENPS